MTTDTKRTEDDKVPPDDTEVFWEILTLRDWFATFALVGILSSLRSTYPDSEALARRAYDAADAMLNIRTEPSKEHRNEH